MGLAKAVITGSHSNTNKASGTLFYMSPELFDEESVDYFCADIYSFGILMHLLLTGNLPFHDYETYKLPILHLKNKLQVQKRTFNSQFE